VYTAILESLARAYYEWKTTSRASTPESKVEEHPTRGAIPAPQPKPENTQERDLPPHMARPPCDPVLNQAIDQINAPCQYDKSTEDFGRRRAVAQRVTATSITAPQPEGSSSYDTNPPPTVLAPIPTGRQGTVPNNRLSIVELYPPPTHIPLLDQWEDQVSFQQLCDVAITETGQSRIDDQCVRFLGHRPVGHIYHFTGQVGGGHDPGGNDSSSDGENNNHRNNPQLPD
jgi:hypothetical protein